MDRARQRPNIPGSYAILLFTASDFTSITSHIHNWKEIEENNRIGKTRDLFKKIRATKGTFHANMGTIKDRNGMD